MQERPPADFVFGQGHGHAQHTAFTCLVHAYDNPTNSPLFGPENRMTAYWGGNFTAAYDGDGQQA